MALVLLNPVVVVNAVVITRNVFQATIETGSEDVDLTAIGSVYEESTHGTRSASVSLSCFQDYADGALDDLLWPLQQSGVVFPVAIKPQPAGISASNPEYRMTGRLPQYTPLDASIGAASTVEVTIVNASQFGVTRAVI